MKSSFSSCPQHESFEELAALAAIGELSPLELQRLRHHLAECQPCRDASEAFADVALNDLGVAAAAAHSSGDVSMGEADEMEARQHLGRLRNRLKANASAQRFPVDVTSSEAGKNHRARLWAYRRVGYGIAATVLLAVAVAVSGIALWRTTKDVSAERARSRGLQSVVDSLKQEKKNDRDGSDSAVLRSLRESQKARDTLEKSLAGSEAKNEELREREKASEVKLVGLIATAEQLRQQLAMNDSDRERLARLQRDSDAKLHEALAELYQARQANAQLAAKGDAREDATLEADMQPPSESGASTPSPSEGEARNLFGARDLHIVDVYDVTGDGKTKRTYGRVYYVEKKLLVFYAFDLQNRQNHKLGAFQAWGYREANVGKPLDLGLFTVDDKSTSRWVLTVNHPDVLSHIDAVFVTVEPPGGSAAPRGKKVLYANLIGPPNHP
jgi:hypothetical protein